MTKYRVKEYTRASGEKFYDLQERFLFFFWSSVFWGYYDTEEEAIKALEKESGLEIIKTRTLTEI